MALLIQTGKRRMLSRLLPGISAAFLLYAGAQGQTLEEYQVKAAFLYNFAKFVNWPPQTFRSPDEPITICVAGEDPFGGVLRDTIKGREAAGRTLVVKNVSSAGHLAGCQILFISNSEGKRFSLLSRIKQCGVLTVGETAGFAAAGGVINFKLKDGRVRFEINVDEAQQRELRISSKLLTLAEVVKK